MRGVRLVGITPGVDPIPENLKEFGYSVKAERGSESEKMGSECLFKQCPRVLPERSRTIQSIGFRNAKSKR